MTNFEQLTPTKKFPERAAFKAIQAFFSELDRPTHRRLLDEWSLNFRLLHGELETQRQADLHHSTAEYGLPGTSKGDFLRLVLALETYYCLVLAALGHKAVTGRTDFEVPELLDGSAMRARGVFNFSAPEWCSWLHLSGTGQAAASVVLQEVSLLEVGQYDKDLVKHLFHGIFSKELRHSLGEIYTPDWLAELTVSDAIADDPHASTATYLDPTCGSGTFLIDVIRRFLPSRGIGLSQQIFGFDINPVSAFAAKTNLLLMWGNHLDSSELWLPVFELDCLRTSFTSESVQLFSRQKLSDRAFAEGKRILAQRPRYSDLIRECSGLLHRGTLSSRETEGLLAELVGATLSGVKYVVGNPPWVNWEYLPQDYKMETAHIWQHYGLFDLKGRDATFIKEDIASLITYVAADRFLAPGGTLAFVIKQSLFKSSKQASGFRKFHIAPENVPLQIVKVEDLTGIKPFPGVGARAAIMLLKKGASTHYPVEYNEWKPNGRASFREDEELSAVLKDVAIENLEAHPADAADATSGWTTSHASKREGIARVLGTTDYRARTGLFTGGLNAAFWMRGISADSQCIRTQNISERAKNKLPERVVDLERDVVYPFVTGSDIGFWSFGYSRYILCPHTAETKMEPMPVEVMKAKFPKAWSYLEGLREPLQSRKGFAGWEKGIHERYFYALQRIGEYTFAEYKVAWRFISSKFLPAVVAPVHDTFLGNAIPIPNEKVIFVACESREEAYYLCGVLSATDYREAVESFMVSTQVGPHVLDKLRIPKFDPSNSTHKFISQTCHKGHGGSEEDVRRAVAAIDSRLKESGL